MKQAAFLLGVILLFTASVGAQVSSDISLPSSSAASATLFTSAPEASPMFALATPPAASPLGAVAPASPAPDAQNNNPSPTVFGVFQTYNWQATAGYTFLRFYLVPHPSTVLNTNGLNLGIVYYPRGEWIGADGEFVATFGSLYGNSANFAMAMGGPRFRWSAPRGLELWAHGLVGGAHLRPQTVYGNQGAFAYEVGGGVDVGVHQRRIAYRLQADMVGTRFFSTYQYSPKVSIGIVFKY